MYDVQELPDIMFPLKFTTIDHYQWEYNDKKAKLLHEKYIKGYFMQDGILIHWQLTKKNSDSIETSKICNTLVTCVYHPSCTGSYRGDKFPIFILEQHKRRQTKGIKKV